MSLYIETGCDIYLELPVQIVFKDSRQDTGQVRIITSQAKMFGEIPLGCILKCPVFVKLSLQMDIEVVKFSIAKTMALKDR